MEPTLRKPATGPSALYYDITPMPDGRHLAIEANVQLLADSAFVAEIEAASGIADIVEVQDAHTVIVQLKPDGVQVAVVGRIIARLIDKYFLA
jgi:pantoate kinase